MSRHVENLQKILTFLYRCGFVFPSCIRLSILYLNHIEVTMDKSRISRVVHIYSLAGLVLVVRTDFQGNFAGKLLYLIKITYTRKCNYLSLLKFTCITLYKYKFVNLYCGIPIMLY